MTVGALKTYLTEHEGIPSDRIATEPDTREKRAIGALWERESSGEGLFLMAEKSIDGRDVRRQLMEKIGALRG